MDADVQGQKSISGQQGPAISYGILGTVPASSLSYRNLLQAAQLDHCHTAISLPHINNVLSPSHAHAVGLSGKRFYQTCTYFHSAQEMHSISKSGIEMKKNAP